MKIEPFKNVPMYHFNVAPDIDRYWKIFNRLIELENIEIRQHDGIVTDFWTDHKEWDEYIFDFLKNCLDFVVKDNNKDTYSLANEYGSGIWTQITKEGITHQC